MPELLLELRMEEIPARMQAAAAAQLRRLVTEGLATERLSFTRADAFVTPRRLALVVSEVPARQPDRHIERRGPRADAPEKAIQGFLRATGLTRDACEVRESAKGAFLFAVIDEPGRPTPAVLAEVIGKAVAGFSWPRAMRWSRRTGEGASVTFALEWVRPLTGLLALFDGKPLPGGLDLGVHGERAPRWAAVGDEGSALLPAGDTTTGHRFLAPQPMAVRDFTDYAQRLRSGYVMLDADKRRESIHADAAMLAGAEGLTVKPDDALLDEVAGLIEWPVVLLGRIDTAFLDLPAEVLATAMRAHQKYFSLLDGEGRPAPRFVFVADMLAQDGGAAIIAGNERVLRARLADARHFWDRDRRTRLEERVPALERIVFHAKLGSVGEKVHRLQTIAGELAAHVPGAEASKARRAGLLAKADLVTGMVGEFPELQGVMGRYYALAEGEDPEVAEAIADHYSPAGPGDRCPSAPVSVALALADRLDTLVGFWAIGETPTGSKDPFALRRAALGVIRLVLENRLRLPLGEAFTTAAKGLAALDPSLESRFDSAALTGFFADRLKVHLRGQGVAHDHVAAVFALEGEDDLLRIVARVRALGAFLASADGANLLTAYRRAGNIVRLEARKDGARYDGAEVDPTLAEGLERGGAERTLFAVLARVEEGLAPALRAERFSDAMTLLAELRGPVDRFFEAVTVNVEDKALRANRLRLLARITETMDRVAVFSQIQGGDDERRSGQGRTR